MGLRELTERLGDLEALDKVNDTLRDGVLTLEGSPVWPWLRGRWLGHPAHPMLTDAPVGLWSSAVVLDLLGGDGAERSADRLVALGIASAVPTALTGMADWSQTSVKTRRQGAVHAMLNSTAWSLFVASLAARRRNRPLGKRLALAGELILLASAYIGGHLTYAEGVGVDERAAVEPATPLS